MSEDEKIILKSNANIESSEEKIKEPSEEKIKSSDSKDINRTNEKLINEFDEYFENNYNNKDNNIPNMPNCFHIENNNDLNINGVNQFPCFLDKDQFYQSFLLFQRYLYWNMHKNYMQNINQKQNNNNKNININDVNKNINEKINIQLNNDNNDNNNNIDINIKKKEEDKFSDNNIKKINIVPQQGEESDKYLSNKKNDKNKLINQESNYNNVFYESKYSSKPKNRKIENYDDKPIKSTHKNFLELLENSLKNKNLEIFDKIYKGNIKLKKKNIFEKKKMFNSIEYFLYFNDNINDKKVIKKKYSFDNIINKNNLYKNIFEQKNKKIILKIIKMKK